MWTITNYPQRPEQRPLGPGLVWLILQGLDRDGKVNLSLPSQAWWLSGLAVGGCWLLLNLMVYLAARQSHSGRLYSRNHLHWLPTLQDRYIDLYLLIFGALLFWQLNYSGSLLMRRLRSSEFADPFLLIGPFLLVVAGALIFTRLWPFLLRWSAWLSRRERGWLLTLSLNRLAKYPDQASLFLLQISLTVGFIFFSHVLHEVLASGTDSMMAELAAGAFWLNALVMFLFCVAVFCLTYALVMRGRCRPSRNLIAMGFSPRQITWLLFVESVPNRRGSSTNGRWWALPGSSPPAIY